MARTGWLSAGGGPARDPMADPEQGDEEERPREGDGFWDAFSPGARRIVAHARWLAAAFFGSWMAAYAGSRFDLDALHYAGLGGVGLTMVLVLVWLSP